MTAKNYLQALENVEKGMGDLGQAHPQLMKSFGALHQAGSADGKLSKATKELIALAIAITVRCDGCIAFHVNEALESGATREEIVEAIGMAVVMGGGPSVVYGSAALEAVDQFQAVG